MTCCDACGQPLPNKGLDLNQRLLRVRGEERWLTVTEWLLLARLHKSDGKFLSYEQLLLAMRSGYKEGSTMLNLRAYIFRVRTKLRDSGYRIVTRSGFGYMLEPIPPRGAKHATQSALPGH